MVVVRHLPLFIVHSPVPHCFASFESHKKRRINTVPNRRACNKLEIWLIIPYALNKKMIIRDVFRNIQQQCTHSTCASYLRLRIYKEEKRQKAGDTRNEESTAYMLNAHGRRRRRSKQERNNGSSCTLKMK